MLPNFHHDAQACVEAVLSEVGPNIVLALPIAIGKPNHFVNALYARAAADPKITLKIYTGLSFIRPTFKSDLERRFLGPIIDKIFNGYPDLAYARDMVAGKLPHNVDVHEFFFQAGALLNAPLAQRNHISLNYTYVSKFLLSAGVNVVAQLVARQGEGEQTRLSLSANTDVSLDILSAKERGEGAGKIIAVAQVNQSLPFMEGEAAVPAGRFDHVLQALHLEFSPLALPKEPVTLADYAAAIHIATLIKDGGTIQLGIGAFSDALAHVLILRHRHNAKFRALVKAIGASELHPSLPPQLEPFEKGLYGSSELFVDGFLALYRAGILKRRAFDDERTQELADSGRLSADEYAKGKLLHAGFIFGSEAFYKELLQMPDEERAAFQMTSVLTVNQLLGGEALRRVQRKHACFVNSAMKVSLGGEAASDELDDGRVVSGVGGQHNFVTQAFELDGGRSIIQLRATRMAGGRLTSNIRKTCAHATIPHHLKDVVVTEYGAVDLRGRSERDTVAAMLNIADSHFQAELLRAAIKMGKIEPSYRIDTRYRDNTGARLARALGGFESDGTLPVFPFGTEFSPVEQTLLRAFAKLKAARGSALALARFLLAGWRGRPQSTDEMVALARMGLTAPTTFKEEFLARLMLGSLRKA